MESSPVGGGSVERWRAVAARAFQHYLDRVALLVYYVQGFYVVTYGMGIYLLNLLIGFLSPMVDLELDADPALPTRGSDEFKPFIRRLPEFKLCRWRNFYDENLLKRQLRRKWKNLSTCLSPPKD